MTEVTGKVSAIYDSIEPDPEVKEPEVKDNIEKATESKGTKVNVVRRVTMDIEDREYVFVFILI